MSTTQTFTADETEALVHFFTTGEILDARTGDTSLRTAAAKLGIDTTDEGFDSDDLNAAILNAFPVLAEAEYQDGIDWTARVAR